jgi:DNA-binding NarL/FixJ family response regulator
MVSEAGRRQPPLAGVTKVVLASLAGAETRGTLGVEADDQMTVRVLIVDDQEPFRLAARMVVEATEGFDVVGEAETGEDSVAMAADLTPDLVLMDVNLPGINGLDATRQILARSGEAVVVLLLSTYEEQEYAPRAAECGAAAYIPKAVFGPDRLEEAWVLASAG